MADFSDDELLYYARQILLDDWDTSAQSRLKCSRVLVVGMGGLGCPMASILARSGVGRLHLLDFDVIEVSNLQRQMLFGLADVGKPKAQIACQRLQADNPYISITYDTLKITDENIASVIRQGVFDLVIDCTDNFAVRDLLNQHCRQERMPLLSCSAIGEVGQIALFEQTTGCYRCLFGDEAGDEQTCASSGVLGSTVHIIGAMGSQVALSFLGRGVNPIRGQLLLWQGKQLRLRGIEFVPDEACLVCGNLAN